MIPCVLDFLKIAIIRLDGQNPDWENEPIFDSPYFKLSGPTKSPRKGVDMQKIFTYM